MARTDGDFIVKVLVLNTNESSTNLNNYLAHSVVNGLARNLGVENVSTACYGDLMARLYEFQPNALLCIDGQHVQRDVILQAKKTGTPIVGWFSEDPFDLSYNLSNQDLYNVVFTNEISTVNEYTKVEAKHLPLGASEDLCRFPVTSDLWYDVCIAGTAWPERVDFCRRLVDRIPNLRWKIILGTNDVIRDYDFPLPKVETDIRYSIRDLCRIYNHSAVTINLRRSFTLDQRRNAFSPPPRIFETALAGTAQIVQTVQNDTLNQYFLPGTEIENFSDVDGCVNKIRDILKDPNRRHEFAVAAQQRALADHLYDQRAVSILSWINDHGATPKKSKSKRNLLICSHDYVEQGGFGGKSARFGGVEILTAKLARYLRDRWHVYLLHPSRKDSKWYLHDFTTDTISEIHIKNLSRYDTLSMFSGEEALKFKQILLQREISFVYFQHLLNYPLLLPLSIAELGIPFAISFHDYYPICHKFNLVDIHNKYCHPDEIPLESCNICLRGSGLKLGRQDKRREILANVLERVCLLHCASSWQKKLIGSIYPEFEQKLQVIEPGCADGTPPETPSNNRKLRVIIPGNVGFHKGASLLLEVVAYFGVLSDKIEFFIPLNVDPPWKEHIERFGNVHFGTRTYDVGEELEMYRGADVALFLSIWPETFLISLSEAWRMCVPVIVTDIGAPSDRVQEGVSGWKVPYDEAGPAINLLSRFLDDRSILDEVRNNLKRLKVTTSDEYCRQIEAFFEKTLVENPAVPGDLQITNSQVAWLQSQLSSQSTIIQWDQSTPTLPTYSRAITPLKVDEGSLIVVAYRYLRKRGIKKFLAAALMYLSRKFGEVSAETADRFAHK